jgi:ABC-2 type transport system permease protein
MIPALKSELLKIKTVRSTYVLLGLALFIELIAAFWALGYKADGVQLSNPDALANVAVSGMNGLALIGSLVGVLLVTHEYRYNTITYTLTSARSRADSFLAKVLTMTAFSLLFGLIFGLLGPLLALTGMKIHGLHLAAQTFPWWDVIWRVSFTAWGLSMFALIIAFIIRNQVATIITLFLLPTTVQAILGIFLKENSKYLPFNALNTIALKTFDLPLIDAAVVVSLWVIGGMIAAWVLFLYRDAN